MEENTFKQISSEIEFFEALTDLLTDAYLLLSPRGVVLAGNLSARELFLREQFGAVRLDALITDPPAKVLRSVQMWAESGSMIPTTLTLPDESIIRCDGARLRSNSPAGSAFLLVRCVPRSESSVTRDFARHSADYAHLQKNIAEKLAHAKQQKEAAETTAAMFAHELANPLNGILTSLDLLQLEMKNSFAAPSAPELLKAAKEEINRVTALLNDFRALARPQVFDFQPADLKKIVEEVMAIELTTLKAAGITFETDFDPALPRVLADTDKLKQAILNICKNSIDAMPEGGLLKISTLVQSGAVSLEIADTGTGIPKNLDPFQVFKTTKADGTGLGLAITAQIISVHKGRIEYVSEEGRGTTFTIYLPDCSAKPPMS
jgi:signal transduction histidine kinase